jgi:hypothetical protein
LRGRSARARRPGDIAVRDPAAWLLALALLCATYSTVSADDSAAGRSVDGVYPISSDDVELVWERVTIWLSRRTVDSAMAPAPGYEKWPASTFTSTVPGLYALARCEFVFHNSGDQPLDVLMAFPAEPRPDPEREDYDTEGLRVRDFRTYVDGLEVPVALEPGATVPPGASGAWASWYTFTVSFEAGEKVNVVNTYQVRNWSDSTGEIHVGYVLVTGRTWKGPIGEATVILHLGDVRPDQVLALWPTDWRFSSDGHTLTWSRTQFEPRSDLHVAFRVTEWDHDGSLAARQAEFAGFLARANADPPPATEELLLELDEARAMGDTVKAVLVRSFIPPDTLPGRPPEVSIEVKGPGRPMLVVRIDDPDGDLEAWRRRVSHPEDGSVVSDFDNGQDGHLVPGVPTGEGWTMLLGDALAYTIVVEAEDATGLVMRETLEWVRPAAPGEQAPDGPSPH